jgi:hypothetical protein
LVMMYSSIADIEAESSSTLPTYTSFRSL